jgi:hypothetical protein
MSIRRRIERLEAAGGEKGCGADCPPGVFRLYRQDSPDGEPVLIRQDGSDTPCPRCGRPAEVGEFFEIVVRTPEEVARVLAEADEAEGA